MTIFERDDSIFVKPKISKRVPGVPLSAYNENDLKKILKEARINPAGCKTKEQLIARYNNPGEHANWVDPVELEKQREAIAAARAEREEKCKEAESWSKMYRRMWSMVMMAVYQAVDWERSAGATNVILAVAVVSVAACWFAVERTLTAIQAKADATTNPNPEPEHADQWCNGSMTVEAYDRYVTLRCKQRCTTGIGLAACVHVSTGFVLPVVVVAFMTPDFVFHCKTVQVHLLGKEVERPF